MFLNQGHLRAHQPPSSLSGEDRTCRCKILQLLLWKHVILHMTLNNLPNLLQSACQRLSCQRSCREELARPFHATRMDARNCMQRKLSRPVSAKSMPTNGYTFILSESGCLRSNTSLRTSASEFENLTSLPAGVSKDSGALPFDAP